MRLLADEDVPRKAIELLRARGHDVAWIRTDAPGSSDADVLAMGRVQNRLVLTFDKDFGELAFHRGEVVLPGVVLFRVKRPSSGCHR